MAPDAVARVNIHAHAKRGERQGMEEVSCTSV